MKKQKVIRRVIYCTIVAFAFTVIVSIKAFAGGPNWATSKEVVWPGLYFDGYIQCQPSYNDNGHHAARGYYVYRNGPAGEVYTYTAYGKSINDGNIYSASSRYKDVWSLDPSIPKVTWGYNFDYVPHGTSIWPVSIPTVTE